MKKIQEDHKEIASGKKKDDEGYMARLELDSIERAIKNLRKVIKSSDTQLPAWVQSKITRAADYIDSATEYLQGDQELDENKDISFDVATDTRIRRGNLVSKKLTGETPEGEQQAARNIAQKLGGTGAALPKKYEHLPPYKRPTQKEEKSLVDQILSEMGCGCNKTNKHSKQIWNSFRILSIFL